MKLKNVAVVVAALVLAVGMTACGGSSSTAASSPFTKMMVRSLFPVKLFAPALLPLALLLMFALVSSIRWRDILV